MSDATELAWVVKAITSGLGGCVEWSVDVQVRVRKELAPHKLTLRIVRSALIEHVRNGGPVVQVPESRESWKDQRQYWYKAIVPMQNFANGLFVEFVLTNSDPDLPEVEMVNAHEQL